MSEGLWDEVTDGSEFSDENIIENIGTDDGGSLAATTAPGTAEVEEAATTPSDTGVTDADVQVELERDAAEETVGEAAEEPAAEDTGRARDPETGRFISKEKQEEQLLLGKFKSPEDLAKAYQELETHTGSLRNEVGQLRQMREEMERLRTELTTPRPQIPSNFDDLLDEESEHFNPARAAQIALDAGNREEYARAKQMWEYASPGAPDLYEASLMMRHEIGQLKNEIKQTQEPLRQGAEIDATVMALSQIKQKHEDFDKYASQMDAVMNERPLYTRALREAIEAGDVQGQFAIFDDLYALVADRNGDNLEQAQREAHKEAAEAALRARQEAVLVSATGNASETKKSEADLIAESWDKLSAPYDSGWLEP